MSTVELIKELRDETGLSFDKIKKALDEVSGDKERALELLRSQAGAAAAKKAEREVKDGAIGAYVHSTGKIGAMVQVGCETDFVARNDDFKTLARDLAMHASAMRPADAAEMLTQPFVKDPSLTVQDVINQAIAKLGENIQLAAVSVLVIG
ncbi:MAG: translation elongation factor Ts [Candidatus Yanofskybacteria bacterium]|nr:translation elongation factor Ts [Candidatus Yanofskybacteria bacterium]